MPRVQYIVDRKGKKTGVFLSYTQYHRLMEDLHDLKVIAERRSEKAVPLSTMKKRLRKNGFV